MLGLESWKFTLNTRVGDFRGFILVFAEFGEIPPVLIGASYLARDVHCIYDNKTGQSGQLTSDILKGVKVNKSVLAILIKLVYK